MTIAALAGDYFIWWGAQVVAVAILILLALRWRPGFLGGKTIGSTITGLLDAREAQIQEQLAAAERSRQEAARIREEAQHDIEKARSEGREIVRRAQQTSQAIQAEMTAHAREEHDRVLAQAKDEIDYERRQAELALRRRAADIVVDAAREVIAGHLGSEADRRIIDESLAHLGDGR